jgi:TolA-binding protein
MNAAFWTNALKNNWYLVVAFAVCVGAFTFKVIVATEEAEDPSPPPRPLTAESMGSGDGLKALQRSQASSRERALETIRKHQERYDANPQADEAPGLLLAAGNLYRQKLGSFEEAAERYEIVANDFAGRPEARTALIQLSTCYERLDDRENARRIYRMMMDEFPEDSQEYQYAYTMMFEGAIPEE